MQLTYSFLKAPFFDTAASSSYFCYLFAFHQTSWKGNCCLYIPNIPCLIWPFQSRLWTPPSIPMVGLDAHGNHLGPRTHFQMFWCNCSEVWLKPCGENLLSPHLQIQSLWKGEGNNFPSRKQFKKAETEMAMFAFLKILKLRGKLFCC